MAGIQELIRVENNNTLSFGNYLMDSKRKIQDFEEDAQITVELEADQEYKVFIQGVQVGKMKTSLAGKIGFGVDFMSGNQKVEIKKA
jgi:hypothetical protein